MTNANTVGVRELHQQTSAVLRRVIDGEVIEVTDHGHPIARIVPMARGRLDQLIFEGRAIPAQGDLLETMEDLGLPLPRVRGGMTPSEALEEMRRDER